MYQPGLGPTLWWEDAEGVQEEEEEAYDDDAEMGDA